MIAVQILEDHDILEPDDWCRPLQIVSMSGGMSDYYSFRSCYTGTPENNAEWVQAKHVIGSGWFGQALSEFTHGMKKLGLGYEFVRGEVPLDHRLNMKGYSSLWRKA